MHSHGERLLSAQVSWGDKQSVPIKQGQEPPPCSEGAALGNLDFVHLPRLFSAGQEPVSPCSPISLVSELFRRVFPLSTGERRSCPLAFFALLGTAFFSGMLWPTKETGFVLKRVEVLHSSAFHSGG